MNNPPDPTWTDRLGNELKKGDHVQLVFDGRPVVAEVIQLIDEHDQTGEHVHLKLQILTPARVPSGRVVKTQKPEPTGPSQKPAGPPDKEAETPSKPKTTRK